MGDASENGDATAIVSVADRVLAQFIEAVADEEELVEVAARLKIALLDGKPLNEAALRRALFEEPNA